MTDPDTTTPDGPPPPDRPGAENDAEVEDVRERFAALAHSSTPSADEEEAFIFNKIQLVGADPNLSSAQKDAAIAGLRRELEEMKRSRGADNEGSPDE